MSKQSNMSKYAKTNNPDRVSKPAKDVIFWEEFSKMSLEDIIDGWAGDKLGVSLAPTTDEDEERKLKQIRLKIQEIEILIRELIRYE